ncbi:MAG: hypothetical protein J2P22_04065 [Nocardioides sp.]|nr:hypothetical protein [Nocardioides sp.]
MTHTYETSVNHVTFGDDKEPYVTIETSERTVITALEKSGRFENVWEDNTRGLPRLVRFRIPLEEVSWAGLAKARITLSAEQKAVRADRLKANRLRSQTPNGARVLEVSEATAAVDGTPTPPGPVYVPPSPERDGGR